jgi:hypothetical protein
MPGETVQKSEPWINAVHRVVKEELDESVLVD